MRSARLAVAGLVLVAGAAGVAWLVTERRVSTIAGPAVPATRAAVSRAPEEPSREPGRGGERPRVEHPTRASASETRGSESESSKPAVEEWTVTIVGRVVDERGAPIADAVLETRSITEASGEGVPRARSDATGWLVALPGATAPWSELGWSELQIIALAHASYTSMLQVQDGMTLHLGTLVLAGGANVSGVVRDEGGAPVADALVTLCAPAAWAEDEEQAGREGEELSWSRTDALGRYRLRGAPARELFMVASAEERLSSQTESFRLHAGEDVSRDLVLLPDGIARVEWTVRILDPRGMPVPGARLGVMKGIPFPTEEVADERGAVRLVLEGGESARLRARDPDERWGPAPEHRRVAEADASFDLTLTEPAHLTVVVADEKGRALPWSNVRLSWEGLDLRPLGEAGSLRILLPQEPFSIRAFAPGYADAVFGPFDPRSLDTDSPLVLRLFPGLAVSGRVLAEGEPVEGAAVSLRWRLDQLLLSSDICSAETPFGLMFTSHGGQATTDSAGAFVISVYKDGWYSALVETSGFPIQAFGPFEVRGGSSTAPDLALARGGALEGRLILPPGESAAGRLVGASNGSGLAFTAPVGEDGRYRIENLAPGSWQVRGCRPPAARVHELSGPMGKGTGELVFDCTIREDATTRYDVDLSAEGSVVLEGRFRAPPGQILWVSLKDGGSEPTGAIGELSLATAEPDSDGRFRLALSRPGRYWIEIHMVDGRFRQPITLAPGIQQWSASPSWGSISVRHQPQGSGPLAESELLLSWRGPGDSRYEVRQWNNSMSLEPTPPFPFPVGEVEVLRVRESVRETLREPFTLLPGESFLLDLQR